MSKVKSSSNEASDLSKDEQRPSSDKASSDNKLNQEIVHMLHNDGRRPYKEIAAALNVSEGTVRNRVNWMRDAGMLKILAIADPVSFNYRTDAMLGIKVGPTSSPKEVAQRLLDISEVVYILWVTGRYDLLVEIASDSEDVLWKFLEERCFNQTDISSVEVMKGLVTYKNQFLLKRDVP